MARDWGGGLPRELLEAVARRVAPGDRFSFRLACKGWAEAGGSREGGGGGKQGGKEVLRGGRRTRTTARAAAVSMARVEWARSCASEEDWERYIKTCEAPGCKKRPSTGFEQGKARWCKAHGHAKGARNVEYQRYYCGMDYWGEALRGAVNS